MAHLSSGDRELAYTRWVEQLAEIGSSVDLTRGQAQSAIIQTDMFVDDNWGVFNDELPPPVQSALTNAQKSAMLAVVTQLRYEVDANG